MTKAEQKQIDRALKQGGLGTMLRTMAQIHRAGSKRTQKTIDEQINSMDAWDQFTMVDGALLHNSEV